MTQNPADAPVFALLTDGVQVEIRRLRAADFDAVCDLHRELSEESLHLRFLGLNRPMGAQVADRVRHRRVGTLLLEHLGSLARARGVVAFRADALAANTTMPLVSDEGYLSAVAERERRADVASLEPLLRPRVIAVVGASWRRGTVGAELVRNIVSGGFKGAVHAVNPRAAGADLHGVPCVATLAELPERPDLVVVTVPADAVVGVAADCGRSGASALVVISSGLSVADGRELMAVCREYGMRLVGPNCLGVANTDVSLDATFGIRHPVPGRAGVASSRAASGSPSWKSCRGWAWVSPRSPPSATSTTSAPTTCSCGGSRRRRRGSESCTWSRSATPASSPGRPAGSPPGCRC